MSHSSEEKVAHGEYGAVSDDECLLRVVFKPEHIKDGVILPSAIPREDIKEKGLSVDRENYVDLKELASRILVQASRVPKERIENELIGINCSDVRSYRDTAGEQAFFVIDSPTEVNPAHASIFGSERTPSKIKQIRNYLLEILQGEYDRGMPRSESIRSRLTSSD